MPKYQKKHPNDPSKGGRPLKQIDENQVRSLAAINCSYEEMALILGCDQSLLTKRFSQAIKEGRASGKSSLKRKQYELAMKGDRTMLIWLGKILCGQVDTNRQVIDQTTVQANINTEAESSALQEIMAELRTVIDTKINERKG